MVAGGDISQQLCRHSWVRQFQPAVLSGAVWEKLTGNHGVQVFFACIWLAYGGESTRDDNINSNGLRTKVNTRLINRLVPVLACYRVLCVEEGCG